MTDTVNSNDLHAFLRSHSRHSRYGGKGDEFVRSTIAYHKDILRRTGWSVIDRHSSYNAQVVKFDHRLFDLNADVPPVDYPSNAGHLAHLLD